MGHRYGSNMVSLTEVMLSNSSAVRGQSRAEEAREGPIREQLPRSLADRTIVSLVGGVADALDLRIATRAWLPVATVNGHLWTKRCHLFGKASSSQSLGRGISFWQICQLQLNL